MSPYEIAIPTYKRHQTVCDKTLDYLARTNVNPERVTLFVADGVEAKWYRESLYHHGWGNEIKIVAGRPGIGPQRNFIHTYYPEGTLVFSFDDDIERLEQRVTEKKTFPVFDLEGLFFQARQALFESKLSLWGIYPALNPFFMKPEISFDFKFICACVYGFVSDHSPALLVRINTKEDYERTCRYYLKEGGVVRFNWIAPKTKYYTEPGGLNGVRTPEENERNVKWLLSEFPGLVKVNPVRKGIWTEVILKDARGSNP